MADLPAFTFLPYLLQGGVGLAVGALADKLLEKGWSRLLVRRVLQGVGMLAPAAALLAAAAIAGENSVQTAAILVARAPVLSSLETTRRAPPLDLRCASSDSLAR